VAEPDILILDEPTAALDEKTEQSIMDSLHYWRNGRTVIVVTHRRSTAQRCDRMVFIDGDRAVEGGICNRRAFRSDSSPLPN